ncbi:hypothetical protein R69927_01009 [Paraburkholderia domus]|nr:hypothetical protein R75483_03986 [Paraburkholderia domus]CAE6828629.1 hypothetical protein R69927_01009 [Paraburkholderia domus]CAE6871061.1 hypothetical protein R75471_00929 [Paraburkholderia domus]
MQFAASISGGFVMSTVDALHVVMRENAMEKLLGHQAALIAGAGSDIGFLVRHTGC